MTRWVRRKLGLVFALCAPRGNRVLDLLRDVAVARFAYIEALVGMFLDPLAGLLQHLQDIPFCDPLLGASQESQRGIALDFSGPARANEGLVCGDERDAVALQVVLDLGALVREPSNPVDRLADHAVKPAVRPPGLL